MDMPTYPGKGLSLSQLVFALNEELRRATNSSLFTLDRVCQLERDVLNALSAIREWKNSFVRINRIPLEVLSLIPTHFTSQRDRFRVTFVCRHWRRTFLQHGALWSELSLHPGDVYVKTLLERTKGSALDVSIRNTTPLGTVALLAPHAQRIKSLDLSLDHRAKLLTFPKVNYEPLPLLDTLKILAFLDEIAPDQPDATSTHASLFRGAVNLKHFFFHSPGVRFLKHFAFPKLTTVELSTSQAELDASDLLGFLKASPALQVVDLVIAAIGLLEDVPRETVVVLPDVETFSLLVNDGMHAYDLAAHISCPHAKDTSLMHEVPNYDLTPNAVPFPAINSWKAIAHQFVVNPVEEVTLEINPSHAVDSITYSLAFKSSDMSVLKLGFEITNIDIDDDEDDPYMHHDDIEYRAFSQAFRVIQSHPLLSCVKRLHIDHMNWTSHATYAPSMTDEVEEFFGSLGPLDELTIHGRDLCVYLTPYLPELEHPGRVFPFVKEFNVAYTEINADMFKSMDAIVELARSQHRAGIPFERVTVRSEEPPVGMEERLRQWVGAVDCSQLL